MYINTHGVEFAFPTMQVHYGMDDNDMPISNDGGTQLNIIIGPSGEVTLKEDNAAFDFKLEDLQGASSIDDITISSSRVENAPEANWYKVEFVVPHGNLVLGPMDEASVSPTPKNFMLDEGDTSEWFKQMIFFENPFSSEQLANANVLPITFSRKIDSSSELPKFFGDIYNALWDTSTINDAGDYGNVTLQGFGEGANEIEIDPDVFSQIKNASFTEDLNGNKSYKELTEMWDFSDGTVPTTSQTVAPNKFGAMLERLDEYVNNLNGILRDMTGQEIFDADTAEFFRGAASSNDIYNRFTDDLNTNTDPNIVFIKAAIEQVKQGIISPSTQQAIDVAYGDQAADISAQLATLPSILPTDSEPEKTTKLNALAQATMPNIVNIIVHKVDSVWTTFNGKVQAYRVGMAKELITSGQDDGNGGQLLPQPKYLGINEDAIRTTNVELDGQQVEVQYAGDGTEQTTEYDTFSGTSHSQLESIVSYLRNAPGLENILGTSGSTEFKQNVDRLLDPQTAFPDGDDIKDMETTQQLFKVFDAFIGRIDDQNIPAEAKAAIRGSDTPLEDILDITYFYGYTEAASQERVKDIVTLFNLAITEITKSSEIVVANGVYEGITDDKRLAIISNNLKVIFDTYSQQDGMTDEARAKLQDYANANYEEDTDKIAAISVLIGELDINKFLRDLSEDGDSIKEIADKIMQLDPMLELPDTLPELSEFAETFRDVAKNMPLILIGVGGATALIGLILAISGLKLNNKALVVTSGLVLAALGGALAASGIIMAPEGALTLHTL